MGCRFFSEPCLLLIQDIYMPTTIIQFLTNSSTFFCRWVLTNTKVLPKITQEFNNKIGIGTEIPVIQQTISYIIFFW